MLKINSNHHAALGPMIPYFLLLLIPSTFALFNTRRLSLILWYLTFCIYVVFVGLRFEIGPDWNQYNIIHQGLNNYNFLDIVTQAEPLSYLLFWFSQTTGCEVYLSNFIAALIMITGVFCFARRTINPWLAVVSATPYFIIVMGMSGIRQSMAAGVILFLFSRWERHSLINRSLFILAAALFHTSALVNNIFLIIKMNIPLRFKAILGGLILLLTLYLSFEVSMYSDNITKYQERYLGSSFVSESFGSLYHIAMIAVPAILGYIFRKRIFNNVHNLSLLHFGLYAAMSVLIINFFSSTVASRLTVYLYFVPMMVYPALVAIFGRRVQLGSMFAVIAFHFVILSAWFTLSDHAIAYNSYKNILFDD